MHAKAFLAIAISLFSLLAHAAPTPIPSPQETVSGILDDVLGDVGRLLAPGEVVAGNPGVTNPAITNPPITNPPIANPASAGGPGALYGASLGFKRDVLTGGGGQYHSGKYNPNSYNNGGYKYEGQNHGGYNYN